MQRAIGRPLYLLVEWLETALTVCAPRSWQLQGEGADSQQHLFEEEQMSCPRLCQMKPAVQVDFLGVDAMAFHALKNHFLQVACERGALQVAPWKKQPH